MASINVIEKTPGTHLEFHVSKDKIIFGDDDLSIKLSSREKDEEVTLDITVDEDQGLMMGTGGDAHAYAAQVIIPARIYEEQERQQTTGVDDDGQPITETAKVPVAVPFDITRCTLVLWGLEV